MLTTESLDIESGWACIAGEVDRDKYVEWVRALYLLSKSPAERLTILFATEGGDVDYSLAIYDLIKRTAKPVDIIVNGPCQSAGTLILQAAARRLSTPNSQFLVHFGSLSADSESETKHNLAVHEKWCRTFAERTGMTIQKSKKIHAVETYLSAEQALKLGMLDEVLP